LKRLAPRTVEALWKNTGEIVAMFSKQECLNYFAADGYDPY
ncbi:MAG: IS630 family transposase, partial [Rhodospirillales bacterium]|nr:IS630 family transposase [Rhodospirillales bacterium]